MLPGWTSQMESRNLAPFFGILSPEEIKAKSEKLFFFFFGFI